MGVYPYVVCLVRLRLFRFLVKTGINFPGTECLEIIGTAGMSSALIMTLQIA